MNGRKIALFLYAAFYNLVTTPVLVAVIAWDTIRTIVRKGSVTELWHEANVMCGELHKKQIECIVNA